MGMATDPNLEDQETGPEIGNCRFSGNSVVEGSERKCSRRKGWGRYRIFPRTERSSVEVELSF